MTQPETVGVPGYILDEMREMTSHDRMPNDKSIDQYPQKLKKNNHKRKNVKDTRDHIFDYIELIPRGSEDWKEIYRLILFDFMRYGGVRVLDIEETSLRNLHTFGGYQKTFFEEDRKLLIDFLRIVIKCYAQFRERQAENFVLLHLYPDMLLVPDDGGEDLPIEEVYEQAINTFEPLYL